MNTREIKQNGMVKEGNKMSRCAGKFQEKVVGGLESLFAAYGKVVARHPIITIILSLILAFLLSAGNIMRKTETDGIKMWLPDGSEFRMHSEFLAKVYSAEERSNLVIVYSKSGNVLTADNLKKIYSLRRDIASFVTQNKTTWENRCKRIPIGSPGGGGAEQLAWPNEVCDAQKNLSELASKACDESHIFEIWANNGKFDSETQRQVDALDDNRVLEAINGNVISGLTQRPLQLKSFLGTISIEDGKIVAAEAMQLTFNGKYFDPEDEDMKKEYELQLEFEQKFLDTVKNATLGDDLVVLRNAARSDIDVNGDAIGGDLQLFIIGYIIVVIYVMIMLGKFNSVENRILVSLTGIISVLLGIFGSYGFSSLLGFFYSDMNSILPFMLLGIGIDDMFVIAQSFDIIEESDRDKPLVERFGLCMKHAGVAITITSVTDLLAFGIGATTALPALQSFCIHAAFGILFVFLFMISFFFGFFVLDQRRAEDTRDAILCCWKKENWKPNKCSQRSILAMIFAAYGNILVKPATKVAVLVVSALFLGISTWRLTELEADFDTTWFIQEGTYLRDFIDAKNEYFASNGGVAGGIYMVDISDLHTKMDEINTIQADVEKLSEVNNVVAGSTSGAFHQAFIGFVSQGFPEQEITSDEFYSYLAEFLFTSGRPYQNALVFNETLECQAKAPKPLIVTMQFRHRRFTGAAEHIKKINELEETLMKHKASLGAKLLFPMAPEYANFKIMEIITGELVRNILLALLCVFLSTLFLIANIWTSLLVLMSVILSLVNVGGFMEIWGLSLDTIAAILISIAMGLTVDYSAHIAHAFMVAEGSRNDRVRETLIDLGPAVLNGGISTFLAFAMLMTSQSYIFKTFFKIFFLIVVFGLYHGLVFLPVMLSLLGPRTNGVSHRPKSALMRSSRVTTAKSVRSVWEKNTMIDLVD